MLKVLTPWKKERFSPYWIVRADMGGNPLLGYARDKESTIFWLSFIFRRYQTEYLTSCMTLEERALSMGYYLL